jgi:hypothetical protein
MKSILSTESPNPQEKEEVRPKKRPIRTPAFDNLTFPAPYEIQELDDGKR